jgi:RNA polymerase sigma-70 factor (ECF subfamily)
MLRSMLTVSGPVKPAEVSAAEDERGQFEALFREHWALVYRMVLRVVGDPDEAEDHALEVFWRLYRKLDRGSGGAEIRNLRGWLCRTATNSALNALRGQKRRAQYEAQAAAVERLENEGTNPTEEIERVEDRMRVRSALAGMKPRDAQLLLLRYSGLTYKELAETLEVAPSSVGTMLARAEKSFEERYRRLEGI